MSDTLVDRYFRVETSGDLDRIVSQFGDDAVVEDEGRLHQGLGAIRRWRAGVPPVSYLVRSIEPTSDGRRAVADVSGDFPGSPVCLAFDFRFAGEKIRALAIRPA